MDMSPQIRRSLLLSLVFSLLVMPGIAPLMASAHAAADTQQENRISNVVNVLKFVRWPENAPQSHNFVFCILGENTFGRELDSLSGRMVDGKAIRPIADISPSFARYCHAVFISVSETDRLPELLQQLKGAPLLTLSEIEGFASAGGMVEVHPLPEGRVVLSVNQQSAEAQGLRISSKLLTLSK